MLLHAVLGSAAVLPTGADATLAVVGDAGLLLNVGILVLLQVELLWEEYNKF